MSSSLPVTVTRMARIADATPANEAGFAHATVRNGDDAPLHGVDIVRVIDRSLVSAGLTNAEAARLMGIDKAHWSRQLNGSDNQHISFQRLVKSMPRAFWLKLLEQLAADLGVVIAHPDIADRALHQLLISVEAAVSYARQDRALRAGGMR
jgi:hypothetical protein